MNKLWEPIRIRRMELKNRFIMAPMVTNLAKPGGEVSDEIVAYYERRAKGGSAMIIVEATAVHPQGVVFDRALKLFDDCHIQGISRIAEAIQRNDCKAVLQLAHPGRQASSKITGSPIVGPSPIPWASFAEVPKELTVAEIEELIRSFAQAASRARDAGFDGVQFHGAHGYLICQFFSPLSNKRTDNYGGDVHRRARFGLEIVNLAREKLGPEYPILFRISGSEIEEGGLTTEDAGIIARLLQDAGVDCIDVSAGHWGTSEWMSQPAFMKPGCIVKYASEIKREVDVPVIAVGRINDPRLAETILEERNADIIALGRPLLSDPDYPVKAKQGRREDIVKCIACNTCLDLIFLYQPIHCVQNPYAGYNLEVEEEGKAEVSRSILVIGEGPAALEATRVAAARGHDAVFWKTKGQPGGHWSWLMHGFVAEKLKAIRSLGVKVETKDHVTVKMVNQLSPDVVLVEKGVIPFVPSIPGINRDNVVQAINILSGEKEIEGRVVILGGSNIGIQVALHLSKKSTDITIIEEKRGLAYEIEQVTRKILVQRLNAHKVKILLRCKATAIEADGVAYLDENGNQQKVQAEHIVLALGIAPRTELIENLEKEGHRVVPLEYCPSQRSVYDFARQGGMAARMI